MFRALLYKIVQAATEPAVWRQQRFVRSCSDPERVQSELLLRILARQAATAYGRDHGLVGVRSPEDFRRRVPISTYETLQPYIERVLQGETTALLADDPLLMFALTSGTTSARKYIPITRQYFRDYRRGWSFWGIRVFRDHRQRRLGLRPILQLAGDPEEFRSPGGTPCGNLSGFTASVQNRLVRSLYCVPPAVGKLKNALSRYYAALRWSLTRPVAIFLAANPSTMLMLARTMNEQREALIQDIHDGTLNKHLEMPHDLRVALSARLRPNPAVARQLAATAEKLGRLYPRDVWPDSTTLMGTWTGGSMRPYLRQIPEYFGDLPIRDLGLLASEGRMSIPFANDTPSGVLDIRSHYFEFLPETEEDSRQPIVLGAHELQEGQSYFILPTTAAGLYRYHISDLVRVTGFLGRTPTIEFLGKGKRFANLTGEKLSEHQVNQAVERAVQRTGFRIRAYSLAPVWQDTQPYYGVFLEEADAAMGDGPLRGFLAALEAALQEFNTEYEAKRSGGRLGALRAVVLADGTWTDWDRRRLEQTGGSPEQYKHPCLIGDLGFRDSVTVRREVAAG